MGAALAEAGHRVTRLAPSGNRSCTSHRITVHDPLAIENHGEINGVHAYSYSGTPADCVPVYSAICSSGPTSSSRESIMG